VLLLLWLSQLRNLPHEMMLRLGLSPLLVLGEEGELRRRVAWHHIHIGVNIAVRMVALQAHPAVVEGSSSNRSHTIRWGHLAKLSLLRLLLILVLVLMMLIHGGLARLLLLLLLCERKSGIGNSTALAADTSASWLLLAVAAPATASNRA